MGHINPPSLQRRLLILVLSVVTIGWILAGAATWLDARHELDELLDSHLAQAAAILVVQQTHEMAEHAGMLDNAPVVHRYAPKVAFQVYHQGRLVLRSENAPGQPLLPEPSRLRTGFDTVSVDGVSWRLYADHGPEDIQVFVGERMASRSEILAAILRGSFIPLIVTLPLLAFAIWWAVRTGLAPLRQFGGALARRRPEALHPLETKDMPEEMVAMVMALNGLFARIGDLLDSERRFTADAAHELRTPIAAIRTQAQVALQESDDGMRNAALKQTMAGCDRAARLIEQLLILARLEAQAAPSERRCDLAVIVRQVVADLAPRAIASGQALAVLGSAHCPVAGDETLLAVLVRNLLENAVRYSPNGASIDIEVSQDGDRFMLVVEDSGPGLPAETIGRLGQRFFRAAGQSQSGSGLGWSIVRRIAQVHGMRIEVMRSQKLGGLRVCVTGVAQT
ncbi:sensor histidine kinase N-terminal domain-containing protein [Noviherbaspirillum sp. DKR-6]|uniref:histidine kinase n=2 Tax=Noviherbaspirillum pedocola TaxID=2801341 RepID=A0A934SY33_9BURK|nr:sensor histidine kinase N-terminal domain-containing protein [Noviherbaspirillum pedocola]